MTKTDERPTRAAAEPVQEYDGEQARVWLYTSPGHPYCSVSVVEKIEGEPGRGFTFAACSLAAARERMKQFAPERTHADVLRCLDLAPPQPSSFSPPSSRRQAEPGRRPSF